MTVIDFRSCEYFFLPVNPLCTTTSTTTVISTTTTTTTTSVPTTTTTTTNPIINCLDGLIIETIYLNHINDVSLLPIGYTHPCAGTIGGHTCNRAFFELYGNGVYMADSLLNNLGGIGGAFTYSGLRTCTDYINTPAPLTGGVWAGNGRSRYSKTILTQQQAVDIANAGGGGTTITLSFLSAMTTYSSICDGQILPHNDINWLRISTPQGVVIWNSCITGNNIYTLDVCTPN